MRCEICKYKKATCWLNAKNLCEQCKDKEKDKGKIKRKSKFMEELVRKYNKK